MMQSVRLETAPTAEVRKSYPKRSLQQYAGDSNTKNGKVLTPVTYPQGISKNSLQRF